MNARLQIDRAIKKIYIAKKRPENESWINMHTSSKQIQLKGPTWSDFTYF